MGEGRPPHGRSRDHLRPYRRIRVVPARTGPGRPAVRLARAVDRHAACGRPEDRARHADGHAAEMAGRRDARHAAGRSRWPGPRLRLPPSLRLLSRRLPAGMRPHRDRTGRTLRRASGRRRLADRQRIRLPRHDPFLFRCSAAGVPGMAEAKVRIARGAEPGVGQRLLVDGSLELRAGRTARRHGDGGKSGCPDGLPPLFLRPGRQLQPPAGRDHPQALARTRRDPQLHGAHALLRSFRPRGRSRRLELGCLPARLPQRSVRPGREMEEAVPPGWRPGLPGLSPRHLPGDVERPLVDHGAAAGARELGAATTRRRARGRFACGHGKPSRTVRRW